jgi:hypothetical protein
MRLPDGRAHYALSPHGAGTLAADARAFARLMAHLRERDPQHTVIMVQVENEAGSYDLARDHAPEPERLFAEPIPAELARALGVARKPWTEAFGPRAEQFFMTWHLARYVDQVAEAGKREWDLPLYVNAALGDAFTDEQGNIGPSGGPNWNALPVWRAAAPHIDAFAPDIYTRDPAAVERFLERYADPGPLVIPEMGNAAEFARFVWPALGHGAVMYGPFGIDQTGYSNYPLGAKLLDEATLEAFAAPFRLLGPASRDWARIASDQPTWGVAKGADGADRETTFGRWKVTAQFAPLGVRRGRLDVDRARRPSAQGRPRRRRAGRAARAEPVPRHRTARAPAPRARRSARRRAGADPVRRGGAVRRRPMGHAPPLERRPDRLWLQLRRRTGVAHGRDGDLRLTAAAIARG